MRDRQLCAVTLAAASVPALLYLPRLGWVWATAAAAISALLLGLCGRRCAPGGLTEVIPAAFGRAGRAVLALVLLGGALLLGGAARALCAIYPESRGGPLTGLLLLLAAAGGSVGALLGMQIFRHKTKHPKFTVGVPLILLVQIGLAVWWVLR